MTVRDVLEWSGQHGRDTACECAARSRLRAGAPAPSDATIGPS